MPNWKKVIVSGSNAALNSLNVTTNVVAQSFTGSLQGTSSWAENAITASYADNFIVAGTLTAQTIVVQTITSSTDYVTGSTIFGSQLSNTHQFTGSVSITGSLTANGISNLTASYAVTASHAVNTLSASYALTASFAQNTDTASNIQGGATNYLPVFNSPTSLSSSVVYQSGSHIGINITNFTSGDPEALYVFQTHPTSFNVVTGKGNSNNYLQLNIQNTNTGTSASSDIVATADNGTETSNYIDMGINGSNFSGPIGEANDAYLYSTGNALHIGNTTPGQHIGFFVGGDDHDIDKKLQLNSNNLHELTGSLNATNGFTGSLYGTASWALNAITASHAVNALSASYALNATNAIVAVTASYADNFTVAGTLTAQTIVVQTITSSTDFVTGSTRFGSLLSNTHQFTGSVNITGSLAVNGSNVILNNQTSSMTVLSSSYAISASYAVNTDLLDGYNRFSFATTGSNTFIGSQTITGSFLVSGSTTQIGNNNLIGNTSLSGSLIISGALSAGTPTIQIFGDVNQTGYTRFLPVVTNIDTSISASYIYVSGSTQDLYFSQNSKGYNNVTRLRWLEGNLYTGLLNGGVISATVGSTTYTVSSGSGIIVDLNASLNDNPYPTIQYVNWGNLTGNISPLTSSYQQAFVSIDSTGNIYQQGTPYTAGQFDTDINIGVVLFQNGSTINAVKTQPSTAYGFEQNQNIFNRAFGPLKLSGFTLAPSGSTTGSLVVGSGTAYAPGSNYTIDPNNPSYAVDPGTSTSKIFRYYQSGSSWVYLTNAGAGYATIDPSQYSNNGVLTTIPSAGSNWSIQRVFWFPNSVAKAIVVYYGNAYYSTEVDAIANINVESFIEAPNTAANAVYLGAIIIKGSGVFTNTTDYKIIPGGLFRQVGGSGGGGSVVTQTLAGLSDVLISGPTNLQPLAYSTAAGKWINTSALSASIAGNANTATTASFALTASYALDAVSSSYALSATSASYALVATSASYALSSSYALNATTASHALTALSSSYALTATTSSHALTALSSSYALNATTASHALTALSSSYTVSSSFATSTINVQGGTINYIPIWKTDTTLSSSAFYQDPVNNNWIGLFTTQPSFSLDVNGTVRSQNDFRALTKVYLSGLVNTPQNNVVGWNSATGELFYQSTSSLLVTTASYAATASTANSGFTIGTTQTYTNIVASTVVGSNNVFTQTTGSYTSAFYKYTVSNGANARSGEVIAVWNGSSAQYTDYSTLDIGSTSGVTPSVSVVGSDVLFNITTGTSGWRLKATVTYL